MKQKYFYSLVIHAVGLTAENIIDGQRNSS